MFTPPWSMLAALIGFHEIVATLSHYVFTAFLDSPPGQAVCHLTYLSLYFFRVKQNLWTQWCQRAPLALSFRITWSK